MLEFLQKYFIQIVACFRDVPLRCSVEDRLNVNVTMH
jgi:hypothetical protein